MALLEVVGLKKTYPTGETALRGIDLAVDGAEVIAILGLSGSGKSTLAFDVLYAEGRRRYVESLSAYARQFLAQRAKPDVDSIDGLSPAVAIAQRRTTTSPRFSRASALARMPSASLVYFAVRPSAIWTS